MTLRRQTLSSISGAMPLKRRPRDCLLTAHVDDVLLARLRSELATNGEAELIEAIARKLTYAARQLSAYSTADLDWRPVARSARPIQVPLDEAVQRALSGHAERLGFAEDVLITTLLHDNSLVSNPLPEERSGQALQLGYLRTERGRGRIYGMYFEMPGYQYAFLRSLGQDAFSAREILDMAFLALAREVCSRSAFAGVAVSLEALNFAKKMLKLEASGGRHPRSP